MSEAAKFCIVSGNQLLEMKLPDDVQLEGAYRRGYSQGYALAVQDLERLLRRGRSNPGSVDAMNAHVDALYRWRRQWRTGMDCPPMLSARTPHEAA